MVAPLVVILLLGLGCQKNAPPNNPPVPVVEPAATTIPPTPIGPTLVQVVHTGGMCPDGPCGSTTTIRRDGTYLVDDEKKGLLTKVELDLLVQQVAQTNFAAIKSRKFTGTCPSAYDGSAATYTFYLSSGSEVLDACQVQVDETKLPFSTIVDYSRKYGR